MDRTKGHWTRYVLKHKGKTVLVHSCVGADMATGLWNKNSAGNLKRKERALTQKMG